MIALLRSQCSLGPSTVLLDVCCGTGTIGLAMASEVRRVVGIESCASAVEDARRNAALNGVANVSFVEGRAESVLSDILRTLTPRELEGVVAIVDPPRAGLHPDVVKGLRACGQLRRLVYVSCHAPGFVSNAVGLCRPPSKSFVGEPFVPLRAFPVDLFPDTEHCELVVVLERAAAGKEGARGAGGAPAGASAGGSGAEAEAGEGPPAAVEGVRGDRECSERDSKRARAD